MREGGTTELTFKNKIDIDDRLQIDTIMIINVLPKQILLHCVNFRINGRD